MPEFPIPFLEDAAAIQIGYMQALYGITSRRLDPKQARLVLAALDGARSNLKQMEACVSKITQVSKNARPGAPSVSDREGKTTQVSKSARTGAPAKPGKKEPVSVRTVEMKSSRRAAKEAV